MKKCLTAVILLVVFVLTGCSGDKLTESEYIQRMNDFAAVLTQSNEDLNQYMSGESIKSIDDLKNLKPTVDSFINKTVAEMDKFIKLNPPDKYAGFHKDYSEFLNTSKTVYQKMGDLYNSNSESEMQSKAEAMTSDTMKMLSSMMSLGNKYGTDPDFKALFGG